MEEEEEVFAHVSYSDSDEFSIVFTSASMFVFQDDEESLGEKGTDLQGSTDSTQILSQYTNIYQKEAHRDEQHAADQHADWISACKQILKM